MPCAQVLSDIPCTSFFATFHNAKAAAVAAQCNLNPVTQRLFSVEPAPRSGDVNWPALQYRCAGWGWG
jgi:hypothetical protein